VSRCCPVPAGHACGAESAHIFSRRQIHAGNSVPTAATSGGTNYDPARTPDATSPPPPPHKLPIHAPRSLGLGCSPAPLPLGYPMITAPARQTWHVYVLQPSQKLIPHAPFKLRTSSLSSQPCGSPAAAETKVGPGNLPESQHLGVEPPDGIHIFHAQTCWWEEGKFSSRLGKQASKGCVATSLPAGCSTGAAGLHTREAGWGALHMHLRFACCSPATHTMQHGTMPAHQPGPKPTRTARRPSMTCRPPAVDCLSRKGGATRQSRWHLPCQSLLALFL
jgi:hypothetical protein